MQEMALAQHCEKDFNWATTEVRKRACKRNAERLHSKYRVKHGNSNISLFATVALQQKFLSSRGTKRKGWNMAAPEVARTRAYAGSILHLSAST